MKITRLLLSLAASASLTAAGHATVLLTFDNGSPTPTSTTITAGDSFSFSVFLTSTAEETVGLTYFLSESTVGDQGNPGSGMFTITARNVAGTPYSDLQTTNATFLLPANAVLDPQNERDAGGLEPDLTPLGAGSYFVATFTIQSSALLQSGTYTLNFANAIYVDENFSSQTFDTLGSYTVKTIPEPTVTALFGLALAMQISSRTRRGKPNEMTACEVLSSRPSNLAGLT